MTTRLTPATLAGSSVHEYRRGDTARVRPARRCRLRQAGVTLTPSMVPSARVVNQLCLDLALVELANLRSGLLECRDKRGVQALSSRRIDLPAADGNSQGQHRQNGCNSRAPRLPGARGATISLAEATIFSGSTPLRLSWLTLSSSPAANLMVFISNSPISIGRLRPCYVKIDICPLLSRARNGLEMRCPAAAASRSPKMRTRGSKTGSAGVHKRIALCTP